MLPNPIARSAPSLSQSLISIDGPPMTLAAEKREMAAAINRELASYSGLVTSVNANAWIPLQIKHTVKLPAVVLNDGQPLTLRLARLAFLQGDGPIPFEQPQRLVSELDKLPANAGSRLRQLMIVGTDSGAVQAAISSHSGLPADANYAFPPTERSELFARLAREAWDLLEGQSNLTIAIFVVLTIANSREQSLGDSATSHSSALVTSRAWSRGDDRECVFFRQRSKAVF
jgi:hypothetical protein